MKAQWLKISVDILTHHKIRKLRRLPGGSDLFVCWVSVLTLAMKSRRPGFLVHSDNVPAITEDIAIDAEVSNEIAAVAIRAFISLGMCVMTDECIEVKNFREYQSLDRIEYYREKERIKKQRQRLEYREKTLLLTNSVPGGQGGGLPGDRPGDTIQETKTETETEKETEKEKKERRGEDATPSGPPPPEKPRKPKEPTKPKDSPLESPPDPNHLLVPAAPIPETDGHRLWEAIYRKDVSIGMLPLDTDIGGKVIYFKQGKAKAESIVKEDGIEAAMAVFKFAYGNRFCQPVRIGNYKTYKARYMAEHGGTGETPDEVNMRIARERQKRREAKDKK